MFTLELSILLALGGVFALVSLLGSLRAAATSAGAIRQALSACPDQRQLRFTIHKTVVRYDDGKVVPLLGTRRIVSLPVQQPERAAA